VIEVAEHFEVPAAVADVWRWLADPYAVVGCVPGAAIVKANDDGSFETALTVKFGPLSVTFQSHTVLELDHERRQGRITARGRDTQGGARFQATGNFSVVPDREGSQVMTRGEVELSGRLASMIETGAAVVVKRMSSEFAACLRARCH
jgi:carbon monoxide dehydrogenase subunit G